MLVTPAPECHYPPAPTGPINWIIALNIGHANHQDDQLVVQQFVQELARVARGA